MFGGTFGVRPERGNREEALSCGERLRAGHATLDWRVLGAFLTAVVLHALWDTFASVKSATFVEFLSVELLSLLVALVSLVLLIRRVREARRAAAEGGGRVA